MPSLFFLSDFKTAASQKRIGRVPNMSVAYTKNFIIVGKLLALSVNIACIKKFSIKQQLFYSTFIIMGNFKLVVTSFP